MPERERTVVMFLARQVPSALLPSVQQAVVDLGGVRPQVGFQLPGGQQGQQGPAAGVMQQTSMQQPMMGNGITGHALGAMQQQPMQQQPMQQQHMQAPSGGMGLAPQMAPMGGHTPMIVHMQQAQQVSMRAGVNVRMITTCTRCPSCSVQCFRWTLHSRIDPST